MKGRRTRWDPETLVCALDGHVVPAGTVARLRPTDLGLGIDLPDGRRFARCLRCDAWVATEPPADPERDTLPPPEEIELPRRGKALRDAIVLRVIAVDRALHALVFALIAAGLVVLHYRLPVLKLEAGDLLDRLGGAVAADGQNPGRDILAHFLQRLLRLQPRSLHILLLTALAYMVIEGVEAVGLWYQRRWAEYLTAVATAGFLPFEIEELTKSVTVVKVAALVINVAILAYLLWAKRLFGLRGGAAADEQALEAAELLGPPPAIQARRTDPVTDPVTPAVGGRPDP